MKHDNAYAAVWMVVTCMLEIDPASNIIATDIMEFSTTRKKNLIINLLLTLLYVWYS